LIEGGALKVKMLLQIHDELIFEAKEKDCEKAMTRIKKEMEGVMGLRLPLEVKVVCGKNWGEL